MQKDFLALGPNSGYILEQYELFLSNPALLDAEWEDYFKSQASSQVPDGQSSELTLKVQKLIYAYRRFGHIKAKVSTINNSQTKNLSNDFQIFDEEQLNEPVICELGNFETVYALITKLEDCYCGTYGSEFEHIESKEERDWLISKLEASRVAPGADKIQSRLRDLVNAEVFEDSLHKKFVGAKRFSLEGGETLIPLTRSIINAGADLGVKDVVFGMAHRGRLNILHNIVQKPLKNFCAEFEDRTLATQQGAGDVKYHAGWESTYNYNSNQVNISLVPNPSHLEFVNPVVEGVVKAKQNYSYSNNPSAVMPILIHGDAAMIGQGVVTETFNFSQINGYSTAGTVHIVVNNELGFTASASETRSTRYCTAFAQALGIPVFHVNGEDVDASCFIAELAAEYRMKFKKDVVVDLYCFRKYGHNEGDDPSFTSPVVYKEVAAKKTVSTIYSEQNSIQDLKQTATEEFKANFEKAMTEEVKFEAREEIKFNQPATEVSENTLKKISAMFTTFPEGFTPHPKVKGLLEKRASAVMAGKGIDWGTAENLAYGSLMQEGVSVRISGQDAARGTFSHRQAQITDYQTEKDYRIPDSLDAKGKFEVYNSCLSEAGVLAFEFGFSSVNLNNLVIWEAQFGDFVNGAQVAIDQFICSSYEKWGQSSKVAMFLPHGMEGQGPEHSSARFERFLQLCANNNMFVCYPSNSAQAFHLYRRHALSKINIPMVVMTPKSLLRLPEATCSINDLSMGRFQEIILDDFSGRKKTETLVMTSGKVFYDIRKAITENNIAGVKLVRVEQLYPFPKEAIQAVLDNGIRKVIWCQEEPRNMGAFMFIRDKLIDQGFIAEYVGRPESASPATGSPKYHAKEQAKIVSDLIEILK